MKKNNLTILLFSILLTYNCGFKVVNQSNITPFQIAEILTDGNTKINYKIKNNLLMNSNKNAEKLIKIIITTKIDKKIKEKNIKNEITKYQVTITSKINYSEINSMKYNQFTITKTGDYTVASQYSQTLNNEKKITELLSNTISEEILENFIRNSNAL